MKHPEFEPAVEMKGGDPCRRAELRMRLVAGARRLGVEDAGFQIVPVRVSGISSDERDEDRDGADHALE